MSKYTSIKVVNDWRIFYHASRLPNYSPIKTIYYDKLSLYLRSKNAANYNFAMAAYLFEMELSQANELNDLRRNIIKRPTVKRETRLGKKNKTLRIGDFATYNRDFDLQIFNEIFEDRTIEKYVLSNQLYEYDSAQSHVYGHDQWYYSDGAVLEENAINNTFSKSQPARFKNKLQAEAKRRFGSYLSPSENLYYY